MINIWANNIIFEKSNWQASTCPSEKHINDQPEPKLLSLFLAVCVVCVCETESGDILTNWWLYRPLQPAKLRALLSTCPSHPSQNIPSIHFTLPHCSMCCQPSRGHLTPIQQNQQLDAEEPGDWLLTLVCVFVYFTVVYYAKLNCSESPAQHYFYYMMQSV